MTKILLESLTSDTEKVTQSQMDHSNSHLENSKKVVEHGSDDGSTKLPSDGSEESVGHTNVTTQNTEKSGGSIEGTFVVVLKPADEPNLKPEEIEKVKDVPVDNTVKTEIDPDKMTLDTEQMTIGIAEKTETVDEVKEVVQVITKVHRDVTCLTIGEVGSVVEVAVSVVVLYSKIMLIMMLIIMIAVGYVNGISLVQEDAHTVGEEGFESTTGVCGLEAPFMQEIERTSVVANSVENVMNVLDDIVLELESLETEQFVTQETKEQEFSIVMNGVESTLIEDAEFVIVSLESLLEQVLVTESLQEQFVEVILLELMVLLSLV